MAEKPANPLPRKTTEEERARIKEMRQEGASLKEIAGRFQISVSAASLIAREGKAKKKSSLSRTLQAQSEGMKRIAPLQPGKVIGYLEWVDVRAMRRGIDTASVVEHVLAYLANGGDVPSSQEIRMMTKS